MNSQPQPQPGTKAPAFSAQAVGFRRHQVRVSPLAARLSPGEGSAMLRYGDAKSFVTMMRSGVRPDGSTVSPVMPFGALREMSDVDLEALYMHLKGPAPRDIASQ